MSEALGEQIGALERAVVQLLGEVARLRREIQSGASGGRSVDAPVVDPQVLGRLVDQLGSNTVARAVVESYVDALPGRLIAVSVGPDESGAATELRLASELVGASALAIWCRDRRGEPPMTTTIEGLERWLLELGDGVSVMASR